jgi:hypothetical protein
MQFGSAPHPQGKSLHVRTIAGRICPMLTMVEQYCDPDQHV